MIDALVDFVRAGRILRPGVDILDRDLTSRTGWYLIHK
jgi:hypothetical protein